MFKLLIEDDEGKTTVVPLIRDEITIGRKEGNTIRLTERNVSRRHAKLTKASGAIQIEDCGSYNGIRVNGARIQGKIAVGEGDRIQIGDYLLALRMDRPSTESRDPFHEMRTQPIERSEEDKTERDTRPMTAATPPPVERERDTVRDGRESSDTVRMQTVPASSFDYGAFRGGGGAGDFGSDDITRLPGDVGISYPGAPAPAAPAEAGATPSEGTQPQRPVRLVVVSANFAGQEFLIDKPTVVVGRTEENDVVLNHRSISRHHAKIVREHGRFNIVDLQSANGVRVNGEPYGKVELRKGDLIDLGHVRLRFVEAGEDFVFDRDAEIYDLGERRGMRGVVVATLVAAACAVVLFLFRDKLGFGGDPSTSAPDASAAIAVPPPSDAVQVKVAQLDAPPAGAEALTRLEAAVAKKDWDNAIVAFEELPTTSPLRGKAEPLFEQARKGYVAKHLAAAEQAKAQGRCGPASKEAKSVLMYDEGNTAANEIVRTCQAPVKAPPEERPAPRERPERPERVVTPPPERVTPPPREEINIEATAQEAQNAYMTGQYARALELARKVLKVNRGYIPALSTSGLALCKLKHKDAAAAVFAKLPPQYKSMMRSACQKDGIELE